MIMNMYAVFDTAAKSFQKPFFLYSDELAKRAFQAAINEEQSNDMTAHPEHFKLYALGQFDTVKGEVIPQQATCLVIGDQVKIEKQKQTFEERAKSAKTFLEEIFAILDKNEVRK